MKLKEVLHLFRVATDAPTSYCVLCLRIDSKRRVIENNSLNRVLAALNDEEVWPWKHAEDKNMRVCYVCEARLVSTLKVIELIRSGVVADRLLKCYKKQELIGVSSRNHEHPMKSTVVAWSNRFKAASAFSSLFLTKPITVNIEGNTVGAGLTRHDPKLSALNPPTLSKDLHTKMNYQNKNLGVNNQEINNPIDTRSNLAEQEKRLELPTASTGNTTNSTNSDVTLPICLPQSIAQTIKLSETLTVMNSGKFLALKSPGERVVLHAIYQGTDGKSFVPTLSVMIEGGQLLPMPDFGINKFKSDSSLPGLGISLPGLDNILSTQEQTTTNASTQDNALNKPLGLRSRFMPAPQMSDSKTIVPNLGRTMPPPKTDSVDRGFGMLLQFDAGHHFDVTERTSKLPRVAPNPDSELSHFDATHIDVDSQSENLIDFLETDALSMEEDPLEQAEQVLVPIPVPIKTEFDTDTVSDLKPNADSYMLLNTSIQSSNKLSNVKKALMRLDIINNFKKPVVPLISLKLESNATINLKTYKQYIKKSREFCPKFKSISYNKELVSKSQQFIHSQVNNLSSSIAEVFKTASSKEAKEHSKNKFKSNPAASVRKGKQNNIKMVKHEHLTVVLSDSESDDEEMCLPVQNVVKNPKLKDDYTMDWEDKIPMDVITYMDATDPMLLPQKFTPKYVSAEPSTDGSALGIIVDAYSERDRICIDIDD